MTEQPLIAHIERFVGPITQGWTRGPNGDEMPFSVIECADAHDMRARSFMTLGLSNHAFKSIVSEKLIRQEFLMMVDESSVLASPSILQQVGLETMERGYAYLRGDVIGPRPAFAPGTLLSALYVALPVYFPDDFAVCQSNTLGPIVISWLVPITSKEAEFVRKNGWPAFERLLIETQPDVVNTRRAELQLVQ